MRQTLQRLTCAGNTFGEKSLWPDRKRKRASHLLQLVSVAHDIVVVAEYGVRPGGPEQVWPGSDRDLAGFDHSIYRTRVPQPVGHDLPSATGEIGMIVKAVAGSSRRHQVNRVVVKDEEGRRGVWLTGLRRAEGVHDKTMGAGRGDGAGGGGK